MLMKMMRRISLSMMAALLAPALFALPAFAQTSSDPGGLGADALSAATTGVGLCTAVALVIIAAVIVWRLVKRFSS